MNAMRYLFPRRMVESSEDVLAALMDAYPSDVRSLVKDGCDRPEIEMMIIGLHRWTETKGWPPWFFRSLHPQKGETAEAFWDAIAAELEMPYTAALIGFGDHTRSNTRYEPHFTVASSVTNREVHLCDSDVYKRIARKDTGIRPELGWAIEDAWIFSRSDLNN